MNAATRGVGKKSVTRSKRRRRYLTAEVARSIAVEIANATFAARAQTVWGAGSTAVASDPTNFGAFDQNIFTEWHSRYGGCGVLIYWHVERKSMAIHPQLINCTASEVAAMVEGAMRHGTTMEVEGNYVDSHVLSDRIVSSATTRSCPSVDLQFSIRITIGSWSARMDTNAAAGARTSPMRKKRRASFGSAALALAMMTLSACTGDEPATPDTEAATASVRPDASASTSPSASISLPAFDKPATGRILKHLTNRTSGWRPTVGASKDTGSLDVTIACVGNGHLNVAYGVASPEDSTAKVPCDGTAAHIREETAARGPVTVTIEPSGDQRWSLLLVRGMQVG